MQIYNILSKDFNGFFLKLHNFSFFYELRIQALLKVMLKLIFFYLKYFIFISFVAALNAFSISFFLRVWCSISMCRKDYIIKENESKNSSPLCIQTLIYHTKAISKSCSFYLGYLSTITSSLSLSPLMLVDSRLLLFRNPVMLYGFNSFIPFEGSLFYWRLILA